jgi:DNA-binding LacI/PurR family transcriptional regulator
MSSGPTIYDIAKQAGVGIATVSRVLNGSERVAQSTREAVRKAMVDLGFRPNRAARRLAVRGPNRPRVAALLPLFSTNFYFSVARPIAQGLMAADVDLVLYDVANREAKNRLLDRIVGERACEGLILCSMGIGPERQDQLRRLSIPFVCVDHAIDGVPCVTVDNVVGGELATRCLLDAGAKRLALVTGPSTAHAFRAREEGFVAVAGPHAPVVRCESVFFESGRGSIAGLLDAHPQIDGIVCVNDLLAVGVLEELRARGRKVPDDVQVIGFDDQPMMDVLGLTTVRQPMMAFGEWAARSITRLVADPAASVENAQMGLTLVIRSTTRAPQPQPPAKQQQTTKPVKVPKSSASTRKGR